MKVLRIIFALLCALSIAALPIVGIFWDMEFIVIPLLAACVFFLLMMFFRKKHLEAEERANPTPREADFFHPTADNGDSAPEDGEQNAD